MRPDEAIILDGLYAELREVNEALDNSIDAVSTQWQDQQKLMGLYNPDVIPFHAMDKQGHLLLADLYIARANALTSMVNVRKMMRE